jgi:hypothetical protein
MWIFTRYGFYSVGCADKPDGSLDTETVMVRARRVAHLRSLQKRFAALADCKILTWPKRDYRYRIIVSKTSWIAVLGELAAEQNWSNFKNEAAKYDAASNKDYVRALHDVWSVMNRLQECEDRPHRGSLDD